MLDDQSEYLRNLRHSTAHLLAAAVCDLYPRAKITIGPVIENGFYYDFDFGNLKISESDLPGIEEKMREMAKNWNKFEEIETNLKETRERYKDNPYKLELIEELNVKGERVTLYKSGDFVDLCRGGHIENPGKELQHYKLLKIAGAYWRGSEKNKMLTRIYGTIFPTKTELEQYLYTISEAEKRDHKKIGRELELFMFHETAPGMAYWLPKGVILYNELINFWREEHNKRAYLETFSPLLNKKELYIASGHFDHYWQEMFVSNMGENEIYGVKAMNCPNAHIIYGSKSRSYRDLPLRIADTDPLHRFELSGVLNGLFRVRLFRQDDAHIYVSENQIEEEYQRLFEIVELFYKVFNLQYSFRLGKRPEKFMGDPAVWDRAEDTLMKILKESGKKFSVAEKEGAFYGPKIDILMKDSLGRKWQMGTLQLDFQQPVRFNLKYTDSDGREKTPIAIHRVIYGSLERFIGILTEHYAGAFPLWLSPVQIAILPISDKFAGYAKKVNDKLVEAGIRCEADNSAQTLSKKIRDWEHQKVPYIAIVGKREEEKDEIALRKRHEGDKGLIPVNQLITILKIEIKEKK